MTESLQAITDLNFETMLSITDTAMADTLSLSQRIIRLHGLKLDETLDEAASKLWIENHAMLVSCIVIRCVQSIAKSLSLAADSPDVEKLYGLLIPSLDNVRLALQQRKETLNAE
jgi:hypothetical protein